MGLADILHEFGSFFIVRQASLRHIRSHIRKGDYEEAAKQIVTNRIRRTYVSPSYEGYMSIMRIEGVIKILSESQNPTKAFIAAGDAWLDDKYYKSRNLFDLHCDQVGGPISEALNYYILSKDPSKIFKTARKAIESEDLAHYRAIIAAYEGLKELLSKDEVEYEAYKDQAKNSIREIIYGGWAITRPKPSLFKEALTLIGEIDRLKEDPYRFLKEDFKRYYGIIWDCTRIWDFFDLKPARVSSILNEKLDEQLLHSSSSPQYISIDSIIRFAEHHRAEIDLNKLGKLMAARMDHREGVVAGINYMGERDETGRFIRSFNYNPVS